MIEVSAFEAKIHLSALLDKVSRGEEVLITRRGKAVARLTNPSPHLPSPPSHAIKLTVSVHMGVVRHGDG